MWAGQPDVFKTRAADVDEIIDRPVTVVSDDTPFREQTVAIHVGNHITADEVDIGILARLDELCPCRLRRQIRLLTKRPPSRQPVFLLFDIPFELDNIPRISNAAASRHMERHLMAPWIVFDPSYVCGIIYPAVFNEAAQYVGSYHVCGIGYAGSAVACKFVKDHDNPRVVGIDLDAVDVLVMSEAFGQEHGVVLHRYAAINSAASNALFIASWAS